MRDLEYTQAGDVLLPNIQLTSTEGKPLGKYGRMRRDYLREHKSLLYNHLVLTEQLFPHLCEIQQTASERMERMVAGLLEKYPAPDKRQSQLAWVQHMNMLQAQAEEVILEELIYN